jgi:putative oxidoreductase
MRDHRDFINYKGSHLLSMLIFMSTLIAYLLQLTSLTQRPVNPALMWWSILFGFTTLLLFGLHLAFRNRNKFLSFTPVYLISTLTMLITWRLCVLGDLYIAEWLYLLPFILQLLNYIICAIKDRQQATLSSGNKLEHHNSKYEWQLFFIRIFIGFDLVPHFTEKLFAGSLIRGDDIAAFTQLQVPHATLFVFVAGLIEFFGCFSLGCGFLTRLGSISLTIYLLVASYLGHHFSLGFIWASPGGGWEYPVLWATLIFTFSFFGGSSFSIDHVLYDRFQLPKGIKLLMGIDT